MHRAARHGYTTFELMGVTLLIGGLSLLAAGVLQRERGEAQLIQTRADVREAAAAAGLYLARNAGWPRHVAELREAGFEPRPGTVFCELRASEEEPGSLLIEAAHARGTWRVRTLYPAWNGALAEVATASHGCGDAARHGEYGLRW